MRVRLAACGAPNRKAIASARTQNQLSLSVTSSGTPSPAIPVSARIMACRDPMRASTAATAKQPAAALRFIAIPKTRIRSKLIPKMLAA
jgi:hypothetical protein